MKIFPAIDLYEGKAVRLLKGDYAHMTVYSQQPCLVAADFVAKGAKQAHLVDLEGAKTGETPNFDVVAKIVRETGLYCEVGGGVRSMDVISRYLDAGVARVILGTAAVTQSGFVESAVQRFGDRIAVGADVRDGFVAVKGWVEKSQETLPAFLSRMQSAGVKGLIVTDISRDGAMAGTNRALYGQIQQDYNFSVVASGGVSSMEDVLALRQMNLFGAIVGKAYYTGALDLARAIEESA